MSREAMKLALEALEYIYEGANNQGPHTGISWRCVSKKAKPAITALREALAEQPAQQALDKMAENARELGLDYEPVWGSGFTNKDYEDAMRQRRLHQLTSPPDAFEQLRRKADKPTQVPEGIAKYVDALVKGTHEITSLTIRPKRTWVGLTDEEKSDIWCVVTNRDFVTEDTHVYADAIEAKLKEKNNG